jgi:ATP adenylyltransferase
MERLWAPWRTKYIQGIDRETQCVFCTKPQENDDRKNLILCRGEKSYVLMNLYPYNNGHLMVIPYQHTSSLHELEDETILEVFRLCRRATDVLHTVMRAEGFNVGINLSRIAGAGIDLHLHMHVVPRWNGDTNFMPVIGQTRVISQSLEDAYDSLYPHFQETD